MLFNSYDFVCIFLPISLIGFWLFCRLHKPAFVKGWLILVCLLFYSIWSLKFLFLLFTSIAVNWLLGEALSRQRSRLSEGEKTTPILKLILILGIGFNLGIIGYFKYANFFIDTVNYLGLNLAAIENLILPLAISFYTFQQIGYLVEIARNKGKNYSFPDFLLFVLFFPQLIAGPILNADELIPQFQTFNHRLNFRHLAIGLTLFGVGLFKKTVIADSVAGYATPIFAAADHGETISFLLAWQASLAYTLQLYFDFSGYSDMAMGLSQMFNVKLPMNFFSPYKAISIADFWRRWHISLGRFLRNYLYIPLGGSRQGEMRRYFNLLITMILGGLWHGASWTFVLWGGLHGIYLCIDHGWRRFLKQRGWAFELRSHQWLARLLTLLAVIVSWVLFRATTLSGASQILWGMFGGNGFVLPNNLADHLGFLGLLGVEFGPLQNYAEIQGSLLLLICLGSTLFLPNLYQIMIRESVVLDVYNHLSDQKIAWYTWRPTVKYASLTAVIFVVALIFCNQVSEFLYFQF
jgi:alginate O-acetyltransferase complex protein AlgI